LKYILINEELDNETIPTYIKEIEDLQGEEYTLFITTMGGFFYAVPVLAEVILDSNCRKVICVGDVNSAGVYLLLLLKQQIRVMAYPYVTMNIHLTKLHIQDDIMVKQDDLVNSINSVNLYNHQIIDLLVKTTKIPSNIVERLEKEEEVYLMGAQLVDFGFIDGFVEFNI